MIQGEHIYLRPIGEEDTDRIVAWRNQERVRHNFIYQKPESSFSARSKRPSSMNSEEAVSMKLMESGMVMISR